MLNIFRITWLHRSLLWGCEPFQHGSERALRMAEKRKPCPAAIGALEGTECLWTTVQDI